MENSNTRDERLVENARPMSPSTFAFDTSLELETEVPRNFQDLTMKFEIIDPEVYRRLGRARREERSHSSGKVDRERPHSQQHYEVEAEIHDFPQERIETVPESVELHVRQEQLAEGLSILGMIVDRATRSFYRPAFTNILMMGILRMKSILQRAEKKLTERPVQPVSQPNWMYAKLFSKTNPTEEEIMYRQFLGHCATLIQSNFKGYIKRKRHLIAMRKLHLIKAVVRGWKTRQIYGSSRMKTMRESIAAINARIGQCEVDPTLMSQLTYLYKQLQLNVNLFNDQFAMLEQTGGWVFERNLSRVSDKKKHSHVSISNYQTNYRTHVSSEPVTEAARPPRRRKRQFAAEKHRDKTYESVLPTDVSQIENNSSLTQNISHMIVDERPIKSTGIYTMADGEVVGEQPSKQPKRPIKKNFKSKKPNEEKKQLATQPQRQETPIQPQATDTDLASGSEPTIKTEEDQPKGKPVVTWLVRKERYDPRKAIQEEKKRKQQEAKRKSLAEESSKPSNPPPLQELPRTNEKVKNKTSKKISKRQSLPEDVDQFEAPPKPNEKSQKKAAQAKVNCWSRRPDPVQQQRQRNYYSQHVEDIVELPIQPIVLNHERRHPLYQHLTELQISNIMPVEINLEEHFKAVEVQVNEPAEHKPHRLLKDERHEKFRSNMQRLMEQLDRKKEVRQTVHKTIDELCTTYDSQYMTRFKRLAPKLERLFFERSQETYPLVPIILHSSVFGQTVSGQLDWHSYRRIESKLDRQYKSILETAGK